MAQVEFHSGLAEPLHYACRLLRKAWRQDVRLVVTAPAATLQALDRVLWTFEAQEFVPHVRVNAQVAADATGRLTPIWLCEGEAPAGCPTVLVNLGGEVQPALQRFERIIELVGEDPHERLGARARWRAYEAHAWQIQHHDRGAAS